MLQKMLTTYFNRAPQGDEAASILLHVATHQPSRDHSKFRASDAGKCHRMRYFKRQGVESKQALTLETQMSLQTGNLLHAFIQHALAAEGVLAEQETRLEDAHRIGHLDAVIKQNNLFVLYDFKTVGGKQMYYLKQDSRPKPEHCHQILTYLQMYVNQSEAVYHSIAECRIAYLSRDTMEILELAVPDDPGLVPAVKRDWETLIDYWERQETPPPTTVNWECKYCQYQPTCYPAK